jgi:putative NADPH-quinone reductase
MDTPQWYYWLVNRNAGHHAIKQGILEFCGIKPVKISVFTPVRSADKAKRSR